MQVYLCGPITEDEAFSCNWRDEACKQLGAFFGIEVLNPCRGKDWADVENQGQSTSDELFGKNRFVHRDIYDLARSDLILCCWNGEPGRQSIGTFMELGIAVAAGLPIVLVDPEEQLQQHAFIQELAVAPFDTLDAAIDYITSFTTA